MNQDSDYDLIIEAGKSEVNYWKDLRNYRDLFYILVWRDIKVRYKQTFLGIAWSVLRPFLTMLVFTIVFSRIAQLPSEGDTPYPILVFAALIPWHFFANALGESTNSLIGNQKLITKVYFPRLIVPVSAVATSLVDMLIALLLLMGLMLYYGFLPNWQIICLPFLILLVFLLATGAGLLLSSFNIKYRDFRYIIPFIIQLGLFISPVGFSSTIVPEKWKVLYNLNPMVGIIDGFRWAILGGETFPSALMMAFGITLFIVLLGVYYFRKTERAIADII